MRGSQKSLTICIPVRNGEEKLPDTFHALREIDPDFCDAHILDNASTDGTAALSREWAKRMPNLFVHEFKENTGQPGNFNRCARLASTPWFAWLGAGDLPLPGYYEQCIAYLEQNPLCILAYSSDLHNVPMESYDQPAWQERIKNYLKIFGWGNINYGVMRSNLLQKLLPWQYLLGNDHIVHLNILLHGAIHKIPSKLFKREWPVERDFLSYMRTCTAGSPENLPYFTTAFRSLDMLWGFLRVGEHFFSPGAERAQFLTILHENFYLPLQDIIDERLEIAGTRLKDEKAGEDRRRMLESQLVRISGFIRSMGASRRVAL